MRHPHGQATSTAAWLVTALVSFLALASAPSSAYAILLAEERFPTSAAPTGPEYLLGALVPQNPSSFGFTGPWFTSNGSSPTVNATSLNYADAAFPNETGGKLLSPTDNSRVHRLLSAANPFQSTDSGAVYMSLLLTTGTNSGYRAFEMHNGGNDDAANRTLQIGYSSFTDFPSTSQFGFRVNNNGALDASLGSVNSLVHLFLVKFNLSTNNNADSITVWNNPSLASLVTDPAGGVTVSGFNFVADRLGVGHFSGTNVALDELRIGQTLRDVLSNFLFCDINGNGVCNSSDIAIISDHMYLPGAFADGDVDGSGTVDFADYRLFKDHPLRVVGFDPSGTGGGTVPEPASALLFAVAGLCCWGLSARRYRHQAGAKFFGPCLAAAALLVPLLCWTDAVHAAAEDLLNDTINFSGTQLELRPYAELPTGVINAISMTNRPYDARLYVTTQEGTIYVVNNKPDGSTKLSPWFDAASALQTATGRMMNGNNGQRGLQSLAFHPDFESVGAPGFGKLYTTMLENRPANPTNPSFFYLGNSTYGNGGGDGVLAEWTYNHATGQVEPNSYRELFRTNMPNFDHPIKQAKFNPYAQPGDEDYGLLYMTHGDSNNQDSLNDDPQDRGDVLGKMIRINPLSPAPGVRYTVPATNPFYASSDPSPSGTAVLGEVYAYGFRNPHTYSFNEDDAGNVRILLGDIGRNNIEEINLVVAGGNYGWTKREGTFVHLQGSTYPPNPSPNAGYIYGVSPLPPNEATVGVGPDGKRYVFPVAQYDHNDTDVPLGADYVSAAVASGFVIRNGSDPTLQNQFIFNNFGGDTFNFQSDAYHTDFDAMLAAITQLDPSIASRDQPSELTQAPIQRLRLALDDDNNPGTPAQIFDDFNTMLASSRNDARYGEGVSGEMYISNKRNGKLYLVTNSVVDNQLTLTVDRGTGDMTLTNSTGLDVEINGLSVFSTSGSLDPAKFQSLGGSWTVSPGNSTYLTKQADALSSLTLSGASSEPLGDAFDGKFVAFDEPAGEDLQFLFTTAGADGRVFAGNVVYTGVSTVPTTIVLTVDVASGKAILLNQTPVSQEVEGYTIASLDGSLNPAGWNSLEAQGVDDGDWLASPPLATRFTELQEDGTTTFNNLTPYELGSIFQSGSDQDLKFEFLIAGEGSLRTGMVVYVLAGDYNGDHVVNAADYAVWRDHLGSSDKLPNDMSPGAVTVDDYNVWMQNFGAVLPGPGGGSLAVPEPASLVIFSSVTLSLAVVGRRKTTNSARRPAADVRVGR